MIGDQRWEYISVLYEIQGPEPEDICLPDTHFELSIGQNPRLTDLLWRLWRAHNQPGAIPAFRVETLFRCVLEEVFVCSLNKPSDEAQALFEQVSAYIHEHYADMLTVRGLAEQNGVNENRLFYVFSKYAGMGPGDYLMAYRLNLARELMITSDLPISEVARQVGYADPLYFSRIFRKRFDISPSRLREEFRNNPCAFQDRSIPT